MTSIIRELFAFAVSLFQSRLSLQLEIFGLQHQLNVYRRSIRRPRVRLADLCSAKTPSVDSRADLTE